MRIVEVTNQARKVIKNIQNLYISYTVNHQKYGELLNTLNNINSLDKDVIREVSLIKEKLFNEMIDLLRK
jgi:hypothetical protein